MRSWEILNFAYKTAIDRRSIADNQSNDRLSAIEWLIERSIKRSINRSIADNQLIIRSNKWSIDRSINYQRSNDWSIVWSNDRSIIQSLIIDHSIDYQRSNDWSIVWSTVWSNGRSANDRPFTVIEWSIEWRNDQSIDLIDQSINCCHHCWIVSVVVGSSCSGCFLLWLWSFLVAVVSGQCRQMMRDRTDDIDDQDNNNDNDAPHHHHGVHVVVSSWPLSSAAADDDDNDDDAPDSVGIYLHHHCYRGDDEEATRVLRRCVLQRGGATINLGDGIVAWHQWSFPQLRRGCCGCCFFVVVVGCRDCVVISRSCIVVVAIVVSCYCGWLSRLVVVSHGCVIVSCFAWSFPAVASWLLWWLCLAVVVGCRGWCCIIVSHGCIIVVAVVASCDCGWLSWLPPLSWMLLWLLHSLLFVVMVDDSCCCSCFRVFGGCFPCPCLCSVLFGKLFLLL